MSQVGYPLCYPLVPPSFWCLANISIAPCPLLRHCIRPRHIYSDSDGDTVVTFSKPEKVLISDNEKTYVRKNSDCTAVVCRGSSVIVLLARQTFGHFLLFRALSLFRTPLQLHRVFWGALLGINVQYCLRFYTYRIPVLL